MKALTTASNFSNRLSQRVFTGRPHKQSVPIRNDLGCEMDGESKPPLYEPEQWRDNDPLLSAEEYEFSQRMRDPLNPNPRDQTRLLELLGVINYRIITGKKVYVEVGGVVYKTLYGGYWRSVFTGIEHYLLRCEELGRSIWTEENGNTTIVDLPIAYSTDGWTAKGHSLSFMLSKD